MAELRLFVVVNVADNRIPDRTDDIYRPSPRLFKRFAGGADILRVGTLVARFVVFEHGGHERPVITRGSKHSRFRFTSRKTGLTQLGEGKGEEFFAYTNEIDGHVFDYQCHPGEFEISRPGGSFRYRPDALRQFVDGTVELIEVKRTLADLSDPEFREKLALVREIARKGGWRFRVIYNSDVYGPCHLVRKRNVEGIFSRRSLLLNRRQESIGKRLASSGGALTWQDLSERLAPGDALSGDAAIECLLARGLFVTNLDRPFSIATVLHPVRPYRGQSLIRL